MEDGEEGGGGGVGWGVHGKHCQGGGCEAAVEV